MRSNTPPALLSKNHIWSLLQVVQADGFIADIADKDEETLVGVAVLVAARSWICSLPNGFEELHDEELIKAISHVARDVSSLLSIDAVRDSMVEDSLRVLQRTCIIVLDNLGAYRPKQEEPF